MGTRNARVILTAEDRASAQIKAIEKALSGGLGGAIKNVGAFLGPTGVALFGFTAAAGVAAVAARKLFNEILVNVQAAAEAQTAEASLAQAIRNRGLAVSEVLPRLKAQAKALQDLTGIDDDAILGNQALLVSLGKLSGEGLERATTAAIDLSKGIKGMDLDAAFTLIAKAAAGSTVALSRYGIKVDETLSKHEKFEAIVQQISVMFGGQAAAALDTYAGRLEEARNRVGNLREELGGPFLDVFETVLREGVSPFIKDVTEGLSATDAYRVSVLKLSITIGELVAEMAPLLNIMETTLIVVVGRANEEIGKLTRSLQFLGALPDFLAGNVDAFNAAMQRTPAAAGAASRAVQALRAQLSDALGLDATFGSVRGPRQAPRVVDDGDEASAAQKAAVAKAHADMLQQQAQFEQARVAAMAAAAAAIQGNDQAQFDAHFAAVQAANALEIQQLRATLDEQTRIKLEHGRRLSADEQAAVDANNAAILAKQQEQLAKLDKMQAEHDAQVVARSNALMMQKAETAIATTERELASRQAAEARGLSLELATMTAAGAVQFALAESQALAVAEMELQAAIEAQDTIGAARLEAMQTQHAQELALFVGTADERAALLAEQREQELELQAGYHEEVLDAEARLSEAQIAWAQMTAREKREAALSGVSAITGAMRALFPRIRAFALADAIATTAQSVSRALSNPPGIPWTIPQGILAGALGAAQVRTIARQKFAAGGVVLPSGWSGPVRGPAGVDRVPALLTAGEVVLPTTPAEGRAFFEGRMAMVPTRATGDRGGAAPGPSEVHVNLQVHGDVLDPEEWFRRNRQGIGRAIRTMLDDGGVR